jgi:hypothetical protein
VPLVRQSLAIESRIMLRLAVVAIVGLGLAAILSGALGPF